MDGQTGGWMGRRLDGRTGGWIGRRIDDWDFVDYTVIDFNHDSRNYHYNRNSFSSNYYSSKFRD